MDSILISYVLPILGIVILLFCFGSFVFPYGDRFKGQIQKVKAFGLDLEVSVITFFVIVGVIFSLTGVYFQIKDYEKIIDEKERVIADKVGKLNEIELEIEPSITLENIDADSLPELENLLCSYKKQGKWYSVKIEEGPFPPDYKIVLEDIAPSAYVEKLMVRDSLTGRMWSTKVGTIATPEYHLSEED